MYATALFRPSKYTPKSAQFSVKIAQHAKKGQKFVSSLLKSTPAWMSDMSYGVTVGIIISDSIIIANGHCVGVKSTLLMPRARLIHFAGELPLFSLLSL